YVGTMIRGSVQVIGLPSSASAFSTKLADWTARVRENNHIDQRPAAKPAPLAAIKHVIYVIKENRTYDQEFGSLGKGNGDPSLNLFGDESAPNSRALERKFVTLDNFYANAEVSAQGWNWAVGANSNPYVEQTWSGNYSSRNHPYDYE